jgi:hypothetical protein
MKRPTDSANAELLGQSNGDGADPAPPPLGYRGPAAADPAPDTVEDSRWFAYIAVALTAVALIVGLALVVGFVYFELRGW